MTYSSSVNQSGNPVSSEYTLARGSHAVPEDGRCAMEWVSYLAGEPHGDQPECVSPVLYVFCTMLNDVLEDVSRQRLRPYLARTIGTATDGLDEARSWMALDWLIRIYAPMWLAVAGLTESANGLAALGPVSDIPGLKTALGLLGPARRDARAAWSAALGAVRVAAWLPRAAGRGAARDAAWRSVGAPAWSAAAVGVRTLACDRASAICREIAGDAAAIVIREAPTGAGRAVARSAARGALATTVDALQQSALGLLDRMLLTVPLAASIAEDTGQTSIQRLCAYEMGAPTSG